MLVTMPAVGVLYVTSTSCGLVAAVWDHIDATRQEVGSAALLGGVMRMTSPNQIAKRTL